MASSNQVRRVAVALSLGTALACSDDPGPTPPAPVPAAVAVSPATLTFHALGDTARLTASVTDQNGQVMADATVSWASSAPAVATVDANGLVTAVGDGTAQVTATAGTASGTAAVTVDAARSTAAREALAALYEATGGPRWTNRDGWLTDAPLGRWHGVTVGADGGVTGLELVQNNLVGEIPARLAELADLRTLDLGYNGLVGGIPPQFWAMPRLERLALGANRLGGGLPPEMGANKRLRTIELFNTEISGSIPPEIGGMEALEELDLFAARLTGAIPPELGGLASLRELSLSANGLVGAIPPELGSLTRLEGLSLDGNDLSGSIPPELSSLTRLSALFLGSNELTGTVPSELGDLSHLQILEISNNGLVGALPASIAGLTRLGSVNWAANAGLCAPGTKRFRDWAEAIGFLVYGDFCDDADRAVLAGLHQTAGGSGWSNADGWLADRTPLNTWFGISTDSIGRVVEVDLADNNLSGTLPSNLGTLHRMTGLRIGDNSLAGRLPVSLVGLPLDELHFGGTGLCAPVEGGFSEWVAGIASVTGSGRECPPPTDREVLSDFFALAGGPGWANRDKWLSDAPLSEWRGVSTAADGSVRGLTLWGNRLSGDLEKILAGLGSLDSLDALVLVGNHFEGALPATIGRLAGLDTLDLSFNYLTGPIPAEVGQLGQLRELWLEANRLTGPIPPEIGDLPLHLLVLYGNRLSGPLPAEMARMTELRGLWLHDNELSGPLPGWLADLSALDTLSLAGNRFEGPLPPGLADVPGLTYLTFDRNALEGGIPPEYGRLAGLRVLSGSDNREMAGVLPIELLALDPMTLAFGGTELCVPDDPLFSAWLHRISRVHVRQCARREGTPAYLTQAVQSLDHPVTLVAGDSALLRVFPTTSRATDELLPAVRATFFHAGAEVHELNIPRGSVPIPSEVRQGSLASSANGVVPAWVVRPGLEMVVEIDPEGAADPGLGVQERIPATGRLAVGVAEVPELALTVVPLLWTAGPDTALAGRVERLTPEDTLLWETRDLLPVGGLAVNVHARVWTSVQPVLNHGETLIREIEALRVAEGSEDYYMGILGEGGGLALDIPSKSSLSILVGSVMAHELGHNLYLHHAPCGGAAGPDPAYPHAGGDIGSWGYDFRTGTVVSPLTRDFMSYCMPLWTSGYNFANALWHRLAPSEAAAPVPASGTASLVLWGGVDRAGDLVLEPAFVVRASARPPPVNGGPYRVAGLDADGRELFGLSFDMRRVLDGAEEAGAFAFALPIEPGWEESLVQIVLVGPEGRIAAGPEGVGPVALLTDGATGALRGFLRGADDVAAAAAGRLPEAGLAVQVSAGVPVGEVWRR